jgi:hypothetical protein
MVGLFSQGTPARVSVQVAVVQLVLRTQFLRTGFLQQTTRQNPGPLSVEGAQVGAEPPLLMQCRQARTATNLKQLL